MIEKRGQSDLIYIKSGWKKFFPAAFFCMNHRVGYAVPIPVRPLNNRFLLFNRVQAML
jgi:hypothetical protein